MSRKVSYLGPAAQEGSFALFTSAIILPLLFILFSLSVDLSNYLQETGNLQETMDQAGLQAFRLLPDAGRAERAARDYLSAHTRHSSSIQISASSDFLTLRSQAAAPLVFAKLFHQGAGLPIRAETRIRTVPQDVLLVLDASFYVAPALDSATAWGGVEWPAATYFSSLVRHLGGDRPGIINPEVLSQQCFNPVLSPLKRAVIAAYSCLSEFKLNSIGVGVFPSSGRLIDAAGTTSLVNQGRLALLRKVRPAAAAAVKFEDYRRSAISSVDCAAAADTEQFFSQYRFPLESLSARNSELVGPDGKPSPERLFSLSVAEALWSRPAAGGTASFVEVLQDISLALITAPVVKEREGLQNRPRASTLIFTGDVPWVNGIRLVSADSPQAQALARQCAELNALSAQRGIKHKLYYVVLRQPDYPRLSGHNLSQLAVLFEGINDSFAKDGFLKLQLIAIESAEELHDKVLKVIALDRQKAVLSW